MAYNGTYSNYSISDFSGGINMKIDEYKLAAKCAHDAQNISTASGTLKTSLGYEKYKTNALSNVTAIKTLMPFYTESDSFIIVAGNGKLVKYDPDTAAETVLKTGMTSDVYDYVNFRESSTRVIIIGNGVDNNQVYNNTTIWDMKKDGMASAESTDNKAPKGSSFELHHSRVWIGGNPTYNDRLYFSTSNDDGHDPEDFTVPLTEEEANQHGGYVDINSWDGGKIIGIKVIFDDVVVFKNYNIYKIYGTSPDTYNKTQVFAANGGIADKSVQSADNKAYFLADDGIYGYDGVNCSNISLALEPLFKTMNANYVSQAVSAFYNNKYIVAIPTGSNVTNDTIIEYDTATGSFMVRKGIVVSSFCKYNDELIFTSYDAYLYKYDSGTTNNGVAISSFWQTGVMDFGMPESKKTLQRLYIQGVSSGDIKITCSTDLRGDKTLVLNLGTDGKVIKKKLKNKGRNLSFKIENINGSTFDIKSIKPIFEIDTD